VRDCEARCCMPFFLHIEVDSSLTPTEFRERVVLPLRQALAREGVGRLLDGDDPDEVGGSYELALEATDEDRARAGNRHRIQGHPRRRIQGHRPW
jgi:hypothetical protein